jgi:hypothetical protein
MFLSQGRASDWCLAGFAVTGGLAGVLSGVRPLLGPDAARLAGPAAVGCAVIATDTGIACVWLGERDTSVVVWLVVVAGLGLVWGVPLLVRQVHR